MLARAERPGVYSGVRPAPPSARRAREAPQAAKGASLACLHGAKPYAAPNTEANPAARLQGRVQQQMRAEVAAQVRRTCGDRCASGTSRFLKWIAHLIGRAFLGTDWTVRIGLWPCEQMWIIYM